MKTKYILIYAGLGIAFLAVSLWVLLSGGRSAKAIRAKYRLGGAMLTVWAMLSASMCQNGPGPFITCYDPAMPDPVTCTVKGKEGMDVTNGDVILADVDKVLLGPYESLRVEVVQGEKVLQNTPLDAPMEENESKAVYAITLDLPAGTAGSIVLDFYLTVLQENGETYEYHLFSERVNIH